MVWTPIDVVSQRLMVRGGHGAHIRYNGGIDAFRKIIQTDGVWRLYREFGISILTYAPSNGVWWVAYSMAHRVVWVGFVVTIWRKKGIVAAVVVGLHQILRRWWRCRRQVSPRLVGFRQWIQFELGIQIQGWSAVDSFTIFLIWVLVLAQLLDDWMLCRIYKKNLSAQKHISDGAPTAKQSHGSSSSS